MLLNTIFSELKVPSHDVVLFVFKYIKLIDNVISIF